MGQTLANTNVMDIINDSEKKIRYIFQGLHHLYLDSIFKEASSTNIQNATIFYEFLITAHNTQNVKINTTLTYIKIISLFSKFLHYKDFEKITKNDIIDFLNSSRKLESEDPSHKWIGTYNTRRMILSKFFRWFYNQYQNNEMDQKKWITPECMQGVKQFLRKEKSTYKPSDIWTDEDHALFLKYCPSKRDKAFHAMANDTSARPHELLNLKIKDIKFKISSTTSMQYAEVHITKSKTKPRTLPLIHSIPYVKDWIDCHPLSTNPDAFLFVSFADKNFGSRLSENALYKVYTSTYRKQYFPKLLKEKIPDVEKSYIRNLLTKPWTPYIQRHSALTSKSSILKEHTLRDYAGWSMSSKMPQVYIHYFGNESSKSLLEAYGIEDNSKKGQTNVLKSKPCPNCSEPNKPDSRFCFRCKMVLTFDSYQETLDKQEQKDREINEMKDQIRILTESQKDIMKLLKHPDKLSKILQNK
jgi:integrase